jgi:hypothetical protein
MHDPTEQRPILWELFAEGILQRFVKRPLLGKPYLEFLAHAMLAVHLYEQGAILGRARVGFLPQLLEMCLLPKNTVEDLPDIEKFTREQVQSRLSRFAGSPTSFFDFYLTTEAARAAEAQNLPPEYGVLFLQAHGRRKVPLETSGAMLWGNNTEGVAFGAMYPELTETMMRAYSEMDPEELRRFRSAGLDIPDWSTTATIDQLEQEVLSVVAPFAAHFYPDLARLLKLS